MRFTLLPTTWDKLWSSNSRNALEVQLLLHTLLVVVALLVSFLVECRSFLMFLSLLEVNMVILRIIAVTITSLRGRLQIPMVSHFSMAKHHSSKLRRPSTLLNLLSLDTLVLDLLNHRLTFLSKLHTITLVLHNNHHKAWFLASH